LLPSGSFIASAERQLDSKGFFRMGVLDSFRLDDKVVIVTGASSGLGVAFAQAFAEAGADVVLGARRVDRLAETAALVEAAGRKPLPVATDVSVPEQCQALVDSAMQTFGRVDILINNAGVGTAQPATRETPEQFRAVIDVNLNGAYWAAGGSCSREVRSSTSPASWESPPPICRRRPTARAKLRSSGLLEISRSNGARERASG